MNNLPKEEINNSKISEDIRLTKIEMMLWGLDGNNGLKSKVQEHEKLLNEIKTQLHDLLHYTKSLEEIKKNLWRIVVILIATAVITLSSKFIQIKTDNETLNEVKAISEETKR